MAIEVDYRYNEQHGQKVMVGAKLNGIGSGYKITYVPSHLQGTVLLQMRVEKPGNSEEIEIFLYEHGRPAESFARRVFPFQMRFE